MADVVNPIPGIDFFDKHTLVVDCTNQFLIDGSTNCKFFLDRSQKLPVLYSISYKDVEARARQIIEKLSQAIHPIEPI